MRNLLFIVCMCLVLGSSAQVFKSGVLGGLSASQVEGDGYGGYKKLNVIIGGFTKADLSEKFSLQFEIYFINKGSFDPARPSEGDIDMFKFNANYIEVPIALMYNFNRFSLGIGPYLSKFLSYSAEDEYGKQEINIYPIKSFDFGGFVGLSYHISEPWIVNLRSKNSLLPFRDFENFDQNIGILNKLFNRGWYHVDINLSIRYQFGN